MVVVVTTGVYTVEGAIEAGMAYVILYQLLDYLPSQWRDLFPILFGIGAITYALHPEGVVEWQKRRLIERRGGVAREPAGGRLRWLCWRRVGVSKRFGGIVALDDVSIERRRR